MHQGLHNSQNPRVRVQTGTKYPYIMPTQTPQPTLYLIGALRIPLKGPKMGSKRGCLWPFLQFIVILIMLR